ncbi:MAG: PilZ domain-containing protein [Candidatus Scalindua sp.]|nr:PilZ domain-containing protein [Candidatus Scalindua sp.]
MISNRVWPKPGENSSFNREQYLTYISGLVENLKRYRDGNIDADTTLIECRRILNEIRDPEFPFFAVQNFKELFTFILYQLPKVASRTQEKLLKPETYKKYVPDTIQTFDGAEKRRYQRIVKSFMIRFRINQCEGYTMILSGWDMVAINDLSAMGVNFNYNKNLGIGSILEFKLNISRSMQTINCTGKVVRIRRNANHPSFSTAIVFADIDKQGIEMINKTAEDILK